MDQKIQDENQARNEMLDGVVESVKTSLTTCLPMALEITAILELACKYPETTITEIILATHKKHAVPLETLVMHLARGFRKGLQFSQNIKTNIIRGC